MKLFDCEKGDVVVFDNEICYIKDAETFDSSYGVGRYFYLVSEDGGGFDWQESGPSKPTEVINLGKGTCQTVITVPGVYPTTVSDKDKQSSVFTHFESEDDLYNFSPYIVASNSCER